MGVGTATGMVLSSRALPLDRRHTGSGGGTGAGQAIGVDGRGSGRGAAMGAMMMMPTMMPGLPPEATSGPAAAGTGGGIRAQEGAFALAKVH